ncbi:MAG: ATP synthase F1 subunit gamma [Cyclobacteriaceae bacterium]
MPNLKEVKNRINSVNSTQQITKAMKMVAAAKLRRAQDRILQMRPYALKLNAILRNVSGAASDDDPSVFSVDRGTERVLIMVVSSDRGLCGGFNSNVFKATVAHIKNNYTHTQSSGNLTILPIGKRSYDYFRKRDYKLVDDYWETMHHLQFEDVKSIAESVMKDFEGQVYDRVDLIYNEFKNVATQIIRTEQFLPIAPPDEAEGAASEIDYIYEPSREEIVRDLIPNSLKIQLYKGLLESNAAEQGARMTAMGQATDNAGELLKQLKLTYNRTRQAAITKEILEIVGGADALKNG